jgi:hypothetical protein
VNFPIDCLSRYDVVVLRHVSGSIYLTIVINSSLYLDSLYLILNHSVGIFVAVIVIV